MASMSGNYKPFGTANGISAVLSAPRGEGVRAGVEEFAPFARLLVLEGNAGWVKVADIKALCMKLVRLDVAYMLGWTLDALLCSSAATSLGGHENGGDGGGGGKSGGCAGRACGGCAQCCCCAADGSGGDSGGSGGGNAGGGG